MFPKPAPGDSFIDHGCRFENSVQFPYGQTMPLGAYSYSHSVFAPCARIGRYCSIGKNVSVFGHHHPLDHMSTNPVFYKPKRFRKLTGTTTEHLGPAFQETPAPVHIGHDVWIGDDVTLRDGITIGDGAVLAANAVVTRDVEPYEIVGGNPCKHIRFRFDADTIARFLAIRWWEIDIQILNQLPMHDPVECLPQLETLDAPRRIPEERYSIAELPAAQRAQPLPAPKQA